MKKKVIVLLLCLVVLGVVGFILFSNKVVSTITLDINPSIEIGLDKNNKVIKVKALNSDAKDIVSSVKGKTLDKVLSNITNSLIDKGYGEDDHTIEILIYATGSISSKETEEKLIKSFDGTGVVPHIIVVEKITKADKELAKKYDISLAKAAYINSIVKDNDKLDIELLTDKSVRDLFSTKETGKYCDKGYSLEGDFCIKEISSEAAKEGKVCPNGDSLIGGGCYSIDDGDQWVCPNGSIYEKSKDTMVELCPDTFTYTIAKGNYSCSEDYTLSGNRCIKKVIEDAFKKHTCPSGYSKLDNGRCINYNKTTDFVDGYVCDKENTRIRGNKCIVLEIIEAKQS
ncbi:MAG: hypothetical protein IJI43_01180 [Bacilli bacterium]|nr:hypothetical protein [Bacilli bacterium]